MTDDGELKNKSILFAAKVNLLPENYSRQELMDEIGKAIGYFHDLIDEAKKDMEEDSQEGESLFGTPYIMIKKRKWLRWFGNSS